jgi:heme a synthase
LSLRLAGVSGELGLGERHTLPFGLAPALAPVTGGRAGVTIWSNIARSGPRSRWSEAARLARSLTSPLTGFQSSCHPAARAIRFQNTRRAPFKGTRSGSITPVPAWLDWILAPVLRLLDRVTAPVLRPSRNAVRGWALALVIANAVAIATGAAVRLSASGLGCPDWPTCTKSSLVAATSTGQTLLNSWIEFGNRLLVVSLTVIAAATFIAFVMYKTGGQRRTDLIWLSAIQPLVVIAQAVVGGITVLAKLNPVLVSAHFLLSALILLPAAVVLHVRTGEGPGPARNLVRADLRILADLLVIAAGAVLAAGTVVTGTGPLAGTEIDKNGHLTTVPRYHLPLQGVTEFHADLAWFVSALAVALLIGLQFAVGTSRRCVIYSRVVLGWIVVQAVIGYVQYFNHLPAGLVWVHVASATGLWVAVLRLSLSMRERAGVPVLDTAGLDAAWLDPAGPAGQASSRLRREQGRYPPGRVDDRGDGGLGDGLISGDQVYDRAGTRLLQKNCPSSVSQHLLHHSHGNRAAVSENRKGNSGEPQRIWTDSAAVPTDTPLLSYGWPFGNPTAPGPEQRGAVAAYVRRTTNLQLSSPPGPRYAIVSQSGRERTLVKPPRTSHHHPEARALSCGLLRARRASSCTSRGNRGQG